MAAKKSNKVKFEFGEGGSLENATFIPGCSCHKVIGDEYYCEIHGGDHWENEQMQPMAGRPATKIEVEAMGAICNLQDKLREARLIIMALSGIESPRTWPERWEDWPDVRKRAIEFLKKE